MAVADPASSLKPTSDLLGQPPGLWVLAGTELWDRVSFHGMQAMLVLYMTGDLLLDRQRTAAIIGFGAYRRALEAVAGPLSDTVIATQTFGFYLAFATGLPLLGGLIGDKLTGRRVAVVGGAVLMTLGHFCMAFDATFLIALLCLMFGAGLLRGNLSAQVRSLYQPGDQREINAFQYYAMSVSIGGFVAPIVSGAVAAVWGWHAGFGVAGFGMLIGLIVYLWGGKFLPSQARRATSVIVATHQKLDRSARRRILGLFLIWPFGVCFWIAQAQVWNIYNVWLRDHVDMNVGGFAVPVPWMQSLDGLAPTVLAFASLWIWGRMAKDGGEPMPLGKMAAGMIIFGAAVALLAFASIMPGAGGKASLVMPVLFHLVSNLGWVWFAPVSTALFATRAPDSWRGTLLGVNALAVSAGSIVSGGMGSLYERIPASSFWLIVAAICGGGGVALLLARPLLDRLLALDPEPDPV